MTRLGLRTTIKVAASIVAAMTALLPHNATGEPIRLKLSYVGSEHTNIYNFGIRPFVDAVNAEGKGLLAIDVYPNSALGSLPEQPQLLLEGRVDIAWVVPGLTPYRFPDNELLELPGLFRDAREGTLVYDHLLAAKALRGYEDFYVVAAYTTEPNTIHSRKPIGSLAALAGRKIRANNAMEAAALERLGATPTVLSVGKLADAITKGAVDGATLTVTAAFDYGVTPVAKNHYLLHGGVAPLILAMSRKRFDALPEAAQALIRKYGGERAASIWSASFAGSEDRLLNQLKSDPQRQVVEPAADDLRAAGRIFRSVIDIWVAKDSRNLELLTKVEKELETIRSTK